MKMEALGNGVDIDIRIVPPKAWDMFDPDTPEARFTMQQQLTSSLGEYLSPEMHEKESPQWLES